MGSINRKREIEEMLAGFKWQATYSLRRIKRSLASEGRSLEKSFRKDFERISNEILVFSYLKAQKETRWQESSSIHIDQDISNGSDSMLTNDTGRSEGVFDISDSGDKDNIMQSTRSDEVVEISDSEDEDNTMQSTIETERDENVPMNGDGHENDNSPNNSMRQSNVDESVGEIHIKEELLNEFKEEVVDDDEDIPLRAFTPKVASQRERSSRSSYAAKLSSKSKPIKKTPKAKRFEPQSQEASCSKAAKRFKCQHCDYECGFQSILNMHMVKHTGDKPFRCEICLHRFNIESKLEQHLNTVHTKNNA